MTLITAQAWWRAIRRNAATTFLILCCGGNAKAGAPWQAAAKAQAAGQGQAMAQTSAVSRLLGSVKSIAGNSITLTTDGGVETMILVQEPTKLWRIAPGQKDLQDATAITIQNIHVGDRILARGKTADDGKPFLAASIIAIASSDIAAQKAQEREEWQKHGVGGLVSGIDRAQGTITITSAIGGDKKNTVVHYSDKTAVRRYAPNSVKFDDAKPATVDQTKIGDQLRARGSRSADGGEIAAEEIVSGTFRNIAGTVFSVDAAAGTIRVQDLAIKKIVLVKITTESQIRKLPAPMAQRLAARLKAVDADNASKTSQTRTEAARSNRGVAGAVAEGPQTADRRDDLQQAINRLPPAKIADLQKGDAVLIVATEGTDADGGTAVTLLAGVEPILEGSAKSGASTILSPWTLGAQGGDAP